MSDQEYIPPIYSLLCATAKFQENLKLFDEPESSETPKMRVVVCDLDGTLCDDRARLQFLKAGRWNDYHALATNDKVNTQVLEKLISYKKKKEYVILLTGRPDRFYGITKDWLKNNEIKYDALYMRSVAKGDSEFMKMQWYEDNKNKFDVVKVYEDLVNVVNMWKKKGLNVRQITIREENDEA